MSYPVNDFDTEVVPVLNPQFDIKKFIFKLIGFLPWIILSLLICYGIAKLYLRYTPQVHKVAAYVLIKDEEENSSDNRILEGLGVMPGGKEVQNQIDILESYSLASNVVDSLNLQMQIIAQGRITSSSLYGENVPLFIHPLKTDTFPFKPASYKLNVYKDKFSITEGSKTSYYLYNDTFSLAGKKLYAEKNVLIKPPKEYTIVIRNAHDVIMQVKEGIDVEKLHEMGGIVEIAMLDNVPERAMDIINTLVQSYNTAGVTDKNIVGYKTLNFLNERIDTVSRELNEIELRSEAFKRNNKIEDISEAGTQYLTQSLNYDNQKIEQLSQIHLLNSLEEYIRNSKNYTDIIPSNKGLTEPTLIKLIEQYNESVLSFQNQTEISTDKDPIIAREKTNLIQLKGNILENIQSIKSGYSTRLNQIASTQNSFENILASLPEKERELIGLKRQSSIKEQLYLYLLQKKEETQLSLASNINNTRVVDDAFDNGVVLPKASQIITFAILIGIIVPIIIMLLIDFFNNKIIDRKEIEAGTKAPIIGEISYDKDKNHLLVNTKSRTVLAEQLRLLGTNLNFMGAKNAIKTILITSFMSGEGKSFISINLARSLAAGNKKVLLLEMDLRKPKFNKYLNIQSKCGLTDYIVNNKNYNDIVVKMPGMENIDVITSGAVPPNPTELLLSDKLIQLLTVLKEKYDYIVIDSSPVGLVADSFSLDKFVDISLFILRHTYSHKTTIHYIEKLFAEKRFKNVGIIVNGITHARGISYGYGYGYGYSYGYGYYSGNGYYEGNKENVSLLNRVFSLFKR
ncbi:MAG: polysaccharide biosynthesis tyrosine autokinase [Chitinophagaceae bacterium]